MKYYSIYTYTFVICLFLPDLVSHRSFSGEGHHLLEKHQNTAGRPILTHCTNVNQNEKDYIVAFNYLY